MVCTCFDRKNDRTDKNMYTSTFVYVYLRVPSELQREILSFVPTRRQSFMDIMEAWSLRCYPNDKFVNITEDEEWKTVHAPRSLGLSVHNAWNDNANMTTHRFASLRLREYIVWRDSGEDVLWNPNPLRLDEYMDKNTFYVAKYAKMRSSIREFNRMAREGTNGTWLRYEGIRWNDATMKFVDPWYGTKYYVCWRKILHRHIEDQMLH